jgi:hypothetical protein
MLEQEDNVVESAETTTEDNEHDYESDSTEEGEGTQTTEGSEQRKPETPEQKRARLERQLSQLNKKLGVKGEETGEKGSKEVDERYDRIELKTEGITSKKEQDIVLDYARYKKIDVTEALKSTTVKAELAEYRSKAAIPAPSSRTGNGSNNSAEYYASQIKNGRLRLSDVKDPAIKKQLKSMRIFG